MDKALKLMFLFVLTSPAIAQTMQQAIIMSPPPSGSNCGAFAFCESITVQASKMGSSDQTNFPVLVTGSTQTKSVGNGGQAQNGSGFDIEYFAGTGCTGTKLNWETAFWSSSTTGSEYWVLPNVTVSHTTNTLIGYRCIGNAAVTTDQSNKTAVWDSNYVYVGHLPNGTTLTANDSTSNGNNGTLVNTPTATAGQMDGAGNFVAASSQDINLGSSSTLKIAGAITMEAWVHLSSNPNFYRIISNLTTSAFTGSELLIHDATTACADDPYLQVGNAGTLQLVCGTGVLSGSTTSVVGTYDGTNGKLYQNGALINTVSFGSNANGTTTANTFIGSWTNGTNNFDGWIDEVRISKIARTADWILAEYNNENSPSTFYTLVTQ